MRHPLAVSLSTHLRRGSHIALVTFGLGAALLRPAAATDAGPVAVGVHVDRIGPDTAITFDLSRAVKADAHVLEGPDRIVVETSALGFQLDPLAGRGTTSNLVRSFRFGQFAPGRSRIVLDLSQPAEVKAVTVVPVASGDPSRLVIRLGRTDRPSFHAAALRSEKEGAVADAAGPTQADAIPSHRPVVVIDPGHGGVDPGAQGTGVVEKAVTLGFAKTLADKLRETGRFEVILTRQDDSFVSLSDRVRIAREAHAQLLVSIHADTVPDGSGVSGATVYTVSDRASDAQAARLAETENKADEQAGVESAPAVTDVSDILFDLTRRETRTFSHSFQRTLVGYWQKIARLNKNPERAAGFMVLKAPDVPSVLLELGYLSSDKDVEALTSPTWQSSAAASVSAAVQTFFDARDRPTDGAQLASGPVEPVVVSIKPHL